MRGTKGLSKNVKALGWVSLFTDVSSEMLYPIIPIFITSVLGASTAILGVIEGLAEATASILKGFGGWLSDRLKRRKIFVVLGYAASAIAKPLLVLATSWGCVLFVRFLDRFGKGVRTAPRDALIAESTDADTKGKAFGFHRSMDSLGAVVGPLAALFLLRLFNNNYRLLFLAAFLPALAGVSLLWIFVKEKRQERKASGVQVSLANWGKFPAQFKRFLFIYGIFAIGNSSDAFLILRARGLVDSLGLVVMLYTLYNLTYSLCSFPFGKLSDRIGRRKLIISGNLIFGAVYLGFAFVKGPALVWLLFAIYGLYMAMTDGVVKAFISDIVEAPVLASGLGFFYMVTGLLAFLASSIAGLLWLKFGAPAPFVYGACTALCSSALLGLFVKNRDT